MPKNFEWFSLNLLDDDTYNIEAINDISMLTGFRDTQQHLMVFGWDNEKIKLILEVLNSLCRKMQLSVHNAENIPVLTYELMNELLLGASFSDLLIEIKAKQVDTILNDFIENRQVRDFFGIAFLISIWMGQNTASSSHQNIFFWFKNTILSYESFACKKHVSQTNLRSCLHHYYDDPDSKIMSEEEAMNEISKNQLKLIYQKKILSIRKALKKDEKDYGELKQKSKAYYIENKPFKNNTHALKQLRNFMKDYNYFNCKRIADSERGDKTIKAWIKQWDDGYCPLEKLSKTKFIVDEIKKVKDSSWEQVFS